MPILRTWGDIPSVINPMLAGAHQEKTDNLNAYFKRYIRILHDNGIHTTTDMITAYLSCSLGGVKGLWRKFFITMQDYLSHQHKYQNEYKKLHSTETTK